MRSSCAEFALKGIEMKEIIEFLSKLLNSPLREDEEIYLTSAQRARLLSWGDRNGIRLNLKILQGKFKISNLLDHHVVADAKNRNETSTSSAYFGSDIGKSRVGIDIQSITEMFPNNTEINYSQILSIFSTYEIQFAKQSGNPKATLAGLFSLKESLLKAGVTELSYVEIEVTHTFEGAPVFFGYDVSISHSGDFVTSIAIKRY
jgi:phosphopantetheine--protein transferase-like protein